MNDKPNNDFWASKSAEQIAAEQGITSPQPLDQLIGAAADLWESDEEFEQFLASIRDRVPPPAVAGAGRP